MPQRGWSAKRERQYEHIKDGLTGRGRAEAIDRRIPGRSRMTKAELERALR